MTRDRGLRDPQGFTLIEMMVAVAILIVVLLALYATLNGAQRAAMVSTRHVQTRDTGRVAIQLMERDLRMAGSGWGLVAVETSDNGNPLQLRGIMPGPGAVSDSIRILGSWGGIARLSQDMPLSTSAIRVDSLAGFTAGDLCVVTNDEGSAHLFQVTSIGTAPNTLVTGPSPWNTAGGHASWPAGGYRQGTTVYRVALVSYAVDSVTYRRPSIVRTEHGQASQLVAYDVHDLQIWYGLLNGARTRAPSDLSMIREIAPVIHAQTGSSSQDSSWTAVRPRVF